MEDNKMNDKGLDRMLVGFFGITGIAILAYAGTQTMPLADKLGTIAFGLLGIGWVLVRVLSCKFARPETA
jgi:predicted acyltransferase